MKFRNNNNAVIKRLASVSYKTSKVRNRLLIGAIALAVIATFVVFSIIAGRIDAEYIENARTAGTAASTILVSPSEEQCEEISKLSYIESVGKEWDFATYMENDVPLIDCAYVDKTGFDEMFKPAFSDINGSYPEKANEIMLSLRGFALLGIEHPERGMEIKLNLHLDKDEEYEGNFVVSGYYTDYNHHYSRPLAFFSESLAKEHNLDLSKPSVLNIKQDIHISGESVEEKLYRDVETLDEVQQFIGGNPLTYTSVEAMVGGYGIGYAFIVLIALCIFLLIYNIMHISLMADVRNYGLMKMIGTTRKQIGKIVLRQVSRVCLFGVVIGAAIGCLFALLLLPKLLSGLYLQNFGEMSAMMSFHPRFLVLATVFAILVTLFSVTGPIRKISKISAVEAAKFIGQKPKYKKSIKRSKNGGKLRFLAWRNTFANKKKSVFTIISLSVGLIVAMCAIVVISGLNLTNQIEAGKDFYIFNQHFPYMSGSSYTDDLSAFDENTVDAIKSLPSVRDIDVDYGGYARFNAEDETWGPLLKANRLLDGMQDTEDEKRAAAATRTDFIGGIAIVSEDSLAEIEDYVEKNGLEVDMEGLRNGTSAIDLHFHEFSPAMEEEAATSLGTTFTIARLDGKPLGEMKFGGWLNKNKKGFPEVESAMGGKGIPMILISEKAFDDLGMVRKVDRMSFNVDPAFESVVKDKTVDILELRNRTLYPVIGEIPTGTEYLYCNAKSDALAAAEAEITATKIIMYAIAAILLLMGVMNYFNVIATGIASRKREFAISEAIGMTKRQLMKILMIEGSYYCIFVTAVMLTIGTACLRYLAGYVKGIRNYFVFSYPMTEVLIAIVIMLAFCITLPIVMYKNTSKESVIESLRND